jgi:hypothetical protein
VRFDSEDGGVTYTGQLIGGKDPKQPQWMANVERPTGFNEVPTNPGMIYTDGGRGAGCDDVLKNKVLWATLN